MPTRCLQLSLGLALAVAAPSIPAASHTQGPTHYLEQAQGRIAYDDTGGPGPLMVALPGMGDLRQQYRLLRPRLVQAGYRVVSMDLRGQGQSSVTWPDYSARAAGQDLVRLIHHLGAESALVLGNSFAAGAALWAAQESPARIQGVVMIGPILRDPPISPLQRTILRIGLAGPWRVGFWTTYWNSLFPLRRPDDHAAYRQALATNLAEEGRMQALRQMIALSKGETEALVGRVRLPTLVLMGSGDPDFADPLAEAAWIASQTGARIHIIPKAGHYPHVEAPDEAARAITEFLGRLRRP